MTIRAAYSRPRCKGGTACGGACISKDKQCIDKLSGRATEIGLKLLAMAEQYGKTVGRDEDSSSRVLATDELARLNYSAEYLKTATASDVQRSAKARGLASRGGEELSEFELSALADVYLNALTSSKQVNISTKGSPAIGLVYVAETGLSNGGTGNVGRAKAVVIQYIEQNGLDAYTGLPLKSLTSAELDHIQPGLDHPSNFVLTSRSVNAFKRDRSLAEFADEIQAVNSDGGKYLAKATAESEARKSNRNAALELLKDKAKDSWTDSEIDSLGAKWYYVGRHLAQNLSYKQPGNRVHSSVMPAKSGVPIVKALAKAHAAKDIARIRRISDTVDKLTEAMAAEYLASGRPSRVRVNEADLL